jgi:hypothetical protein
MIRVLIIESEKGWGSHVDDTKEFPTLEEAEQFCKDYNNKHNPIGPTPDWYMYARIKGDNSIGMLR